MAPLRAVVPSLLSAGVLIPSLVRASLIDQVDAQLTASLPIGVGLSSGRVFPAPDVNLVVAAADEATQRRSHAR